MDLYGLTPEQYITLDLANQNPQDLKDLAYYLWCCFEDEPLLMEWRVKVLLPYVAVSCPADQTEADDEH